MRAMTGVGRISGCIVAASSMLVQPAMSDQVVLRATGVVSNTQDGVAPGLVSFSMPPPFDTVVSGDPWEICIVYDSDTSENVCGTCFNRRVWNDAIVSVSGCVAGIAIGPALPNPASVQHVEMVNSISSGPDAVRFFWDNASTERQLELRVDLNDSTRTLFAGLGKADIPTVLPTSIAPADFTSMAFALTFSNDSDFIDAAVGELSAPVNFSVGPLIDCNNNNTPDDCDIACGTSSDCNSNGIPDECETDCNSNGIPDDCDIAEGDSLDCNSNGVPDECDIDLIIGLSDDCNFNGIPDECETDCNNNGIPDDCDIEAGTSFDCNCNGVPDECDILNGMDVNGDGFVDSCVLCAGDTNCDGMVNYIDMMNVWANLGTSGPTGDVNYDGTVNILDYFVVAWNYGSVCN